jgi:UDP-N-acetylmuramoyl-tripeptide--D-alanyl-D-alanine ligase
LVAGSMLELGPDSAALHKEAARKIAAEDVDLVVAVGLFVPAFARLGDDLGDRLVLAEDAESAFPAMAERLKGNEVVLLKGSRGVALESLIPLLESRFGGGPAENGG